MHPEGSRHQVGVTTATGFLGLHSAFYSLKKACILTVFAQIYRQKR